MEALKLLISYESKILLLGMYCYKIIGQVCEYMCMIAMYVINILMYYHSILYNAKKWKKLSIKRELLN